MEQIHAFIKGISADIDPSKRDSLSWDFPTEGIRVLNHEGQGMMIVPLPGNCNALGDNVATIPLTPNNIVIGACSFAGIIYLVLCSTENSNCEIGSYPSIDIDTGLFQQAYAPLGNKLAGSEELDENGDGARLPFITNKLGYSRHLFSQIDMFAAPSFDNSVNLYLCDYQNPNLCINSGFSVDGYNKQSYNDLSFPYGVRLIKATKSFPSPTFKNLTNDGVLMPGNYWLFFRYVTESFDRTSFLSELGPISVHVGDVTRNIEGVVDETADPTNKTINVSLSNIDPDYSYIEVGVMRYHGPSISNAIREMYLIHKYYVVNGSTLDIHITGDEEQEILTISDVMDFNAVPTICKSHTSAAGRYVGVNWKDVGYNVDAFKEYASRIFLGIKSDIALDDINIAQYESGSSLISQYQDEEKILYMRTHVRGEIYPYAIVGKLTTGGITEAFPIMTQDFMKIHNAGVPIYDGTGLNRFPDFIAGSSLAVDTDGTAVNNLNKPLAITIHNSVALAYYNANVELFKDVIGFYLVRGERKKNLLYQGWSMKCWNRTAMAFFGNNFFDGSVWNVTTEAESLYIPYPISTDFPVEQPTYGMSVLSASKKRFALFSPDYIFSNQKDLVDNGTYHIKKIASYDVANLSSFQKSAVGIDTPTQYAFEENDTNRSLITFNPSYLGSSIVKNTNPDTFKNGSQWSSLFMDYAINSIDYGWKTQSNTRTKTISVQKYIGLEPLDTALNLENTFLAITKYSSAAAYWAAIWDSGNFDVSSEVYTIVTEFNDISTLKSLELLWTGDAFIQRTIFRAIHWKQKIAAEDIAYNHGYVMSFLSENTVNTQMRCDVVANDLTYSFFPKCLYSKSYLTLFEWAVTSESDEAKAEAIYVNAGYNIVNGGRQFNGYNKFIPFRASKHENRTYVSSKQVSGSFTNFYRIMPINSYIDFPWEDGPINSVKEIFGKLITVCDRAINEHYYNESQYRVPTSQGELLLGQTDVLAEQQRKLSTFGSKHTHGIGIVESGIVGVDTDKDIMWRVTPGEGGLKAENLSLTHQFQSWCREKFAILKAVSPILDRPSWGNGVTIGYDPYFKEIHFTILNKTKAYTLTFSEEINAVLGTAPFAYTRYFNDGKDFYSFLQSMTTYSHGLYRHNNKATSMVFNGIQKDMLISVIVNGLSEKENTSQLRKIYKSGSIIAGPNAFHKLDINTLNQHGQLFPFLNTVQFWKTAEFTNGIWEYPLPLQDSPDKDQFQTETDMRGTWARITLTYRNTKTTFIQSIRTLFNVTSI